MEYKVVVSDPKTGKSYQVSVKDEKARKIRGVKIGDELDGAVLGLTGYKLELTGGSDRGGFAMKEGVHGQVAKKILMDKGVGYKAKSGSRARRRVHGQEVGEDIIQVNTKIVGYGSKSVEDLLGIGKEEAGDGDAGAKEADDKGEGGG
jgi:small subunit ribosomal protein S6e